MIWLKENNNFCGYIMVLKKEYSEKEIRDMSRYHGYQGWSQLSQLVMIIQGIEFSYLGTSHKYRIETQRIADIRFGFDFECFFCQTDRMYRKQIFEVFKNVKMYKIREYSSEKWSKIGHMIMELVSSKTFSHVDRDINRDVDIVSRNFEKLQKMFEDKGYPLSHNIFANVNEEILEKIYLERETKTELIMTDL